MSQRWHLVALTVITPVQQGMSYNAASVAVNCPPQKGSHVSFH